MNPSSQTSSSQITEVPPTVIFEDYSFHLGNLSSETWSSWRTCDIHTSPLKLLSLLYFYRRFQTLSFSISKQSVEIRAGNGFEGSGRESDYSQSGRFDRVETLG
jgi:hypothetical protein